MRLKQTESIALGVVLVFPSRFQITLRGLWMERDFHRLLQMFYRRTGWRAIAALLPVYWGWGKMADIMQAIYQIDFLVWKLLHLDSNLTENSWELN